MVDPPRPALQPMALSVVGMPSSAAGVPLPPMPIVQPTFIAPPPISTGNVAIDNCFSDEASKQTDAKVMLATEYQKCSVYGTSIAVARCQKAASEKIRSSLPDIYRMQMQCINTATNNGMRSP